MPSTRDGVNVTFIFKRERDSNKYQVMVSAVQRFILSLAHCVQCDLYGHRRTWESRFSASYYMVLSPFTFEVIYSVNFVINY